MFGFSQIVSEGERVKIKNPTEIYLCVNCEVKKGELFQREKETDKIKIIFCRKKKSKSKESGHKITAISVPLRELLSHSNSARESYVPIE